MKNPKKPTYNQRKTIQKAGLDSHDWLVVKDTSTEMVLIHKHNEKTTKTIQKDWFKSNQFLMTFIGLVIAGFMIGVLLGDPTASLNTETAIPDNLEAPRFAVETITREIHPQTQSIQMTATETASGAMIESTPETIAETVVQTQQQTPQNLSQYTSMGTFKLTAYCSCRICCGKYADGRPKDENGNPIVYTANSSIARQGVTVAADTNILPFGTSLLIDGHEYIVQDRGGAIKGNRIDVYFASHEEARQFGVKYKEVLVKGDL